MKKTGLLHGELSRCIAQMGHQDMILIGDAGMPVPKGVPLIDLALVGGIPSFLDVVNAVLSELCVEEGIVSTEMGQISPNMRENLNQIVEGKFPLVEISHIQIKDLSKGVKAIVRTGEFTPYANIVLKAGVLF